MNNVSSPYVHLKWLWEDTLLQIWTFQHDWWSCKASATKEKGLEPSFLSGELHIRICKSSSFTSGSMFYELQPTVLTNDVIKCSRYLLSNTLGKFCTKSIHYTERILNTTIKYSVDSDERNVMKPDGNHYI